MTSEDQITMFMNVDKHGMLINYTDNEPGEYYVRYVDKRPIDGYLPEGLDRIYDYELLQWFSVPGKPICVYFGDELPYCQGFVNKASK